MFLTGCNDEDLDIIQNLALQCVYNINNPRDAHVNLQMLRPQICH